MDACGSVIFVYNAREGSPVFAWTGVRIENSFKIPFGVKQRKDIHRCWIRINDISISINDYSPCIPLFPSNSPGPSVGVPKSSAVLRRRGGFPRCLLGSAMVITANAFLPFRTRYSNAPLAFTSCEPDVVGFAKTTQLWWRQLLHRWRRIEALLWLWRREPCRIPAHHPLWVVFFLCVKLVLRKFHNWWDSFGARSDHHR